MIGVTIKKRISFVFFISALLISLLMVRVAWIQFVQGPELQAKAIDSRLRNIDVKAKRGVIYDSKGSPLAISVSTDSVYAVPAQVRRSNQVEETAKILAEVLELDLEQTIEKLNKKIAFEWIKRRIPDKTIDELKKLNLPGINFVEENQRFYPKGNLAAHILGFAGIDNQGLNGIEITYEEYLKGVPGKIMIEYDAAGREIPNAMHQYIPPQDGHSIYLTIDETIQYIAERELDQVMKLRDSEKGTVIVMDVKTGDILAMASRPDFDPNHFASFDQSTWRNAAISDAFEPGSTFKIITTAAALEENVVSTDSRFYCAGYIKVGNHNVRCWRHPRAHGSQSFLEAVQNSCNPAFVEIGFDLGKVNFYKYLNGFGFGQRTGIELPGEATGILVPQSRAKDIDLATMSIGQANAITPIQLIRAVTATANDGWLMKPRLVREIRDVEGNLIRKIEPEPIRQVISKDTSDQLGYILETVVSQGTGSNAKIEGYKVAGKTGTAQKILATGGYSTSDYIASFVGFAPADDPRISVLVVVDSPEGIYYGGQVAAPIFKNVMLDVLRYLEVPPEVLNTNESTNNLQVIIPELKGENLASGVKSLTALDLKHRVEGTGDIIIAQLPPAGSRVNKKSEIVLYTHNAEAQKVVVPDLTGTTIRDAGRILNDLGLKIAPQGSGLASLQEPVPGTEVEIGTVIKVKFSPSSQPYEETMSP